MVLDPITGVTQVTGLKIYRPISHLNLSGSHAAGTDIYSGVTMEVRKVNGSKANDESCIPDIGIPMLFEFSTFQEGMFFLQADKSVFRGSVDIASGENGIACDSNNYIEVNLYGLHSDATYYVEGLESSTSSGRMFKYSKQNINSNQKLATFSDNANEYILLPLTHFVELNLIDLTGGSKRWVLNELKSVAYKSNDIVSFNESGAVACGYVNCFVIDLTGIKAFEVKTDGSAYEFYAVDTK